MPSRAAGGCRAGAAPPPPRPRPPPGAPPPRHTPPPARCAGRPPAGPAPPGSPARPPPRQVDSPPPRRRYELAGRLLAQAPTAAGSPPARRALRRAATAVGHGLGAATRRARGGQGRDRVLSGALAGLDACRYEPPPGNGDHRLRQCPLEALPNQSPDRKRPRLNS